MKAPHFPFPREGKVRNGYMINNIISLMSFISFINLINFISLI